MILLTDSTHSLELVTSTAAAVDVQVSWVDLVTGSEPSLTPGSAQAAVASATTTVIAAAPAAGVTRQVKSVTVKNRSYTGNDAVAVTLQKDVSTTNYQLFSGVTLQSGEALVYEDGAGLSVYSADGSRKLALPTIAVPAYLMAPHFATANLTTTKTITSTNTFAVYLGRAGRSLAGVPVRYRVTTAAATITWAELAIAKGDVVLGGNPTLTVVGWANVASVVNSTGQKSTAVNVSAGQSIDTGDNLWALLGNQATTAAVVRAQSIADDLQVGFQGSAVMRPSLNVGTGVAFTLEGATTVAAWMVGGV
jgi:hypothetical protein